MVDSPEHVSERKTVYGEDNYGCEFSDERDLSKLLEDDAQAGVLKVTATTGRGLVPIKDARVYVTKMLDGDRVIFFKGLTDESGAIEDIVLPAPSRAISFDKDGGTPYSSYDIKIEHPLYETMYVYNVPIFEGIKSIQNVSMNEKGV